MDYYTVLRNGWYWYGEVKNLKKYQVYPKIKYFNTIEEAKQDCINQNKEINK